MRLRCEWWVKGCAARLQGCLKPITVHIPPDTILSPGPEAAVVGGNVLTSQRITDVVLKAFNAAAASQVRAPCHPQSGLIFLSCNVCTPLNCCLAQGKTWLQTSLILTGRLCTCAQGCMNNLTFGDADMGYYETVAGGAGAGPGWAGRSGVHTHMTNTRITDPEILERRYPVVLREFSLRPGSGGAGRWRGGDGVVREVCHVAC